MCLRHGSGGALLQPEIVETCGKPGVATLVPFVLILALLLLLDFPEIAVPGLISLKRKVDDQQNKIAAQEEKNNALAMSLQSVQNRVQVNFGPGLLDAYEEQAPLYRAAARSGDSSIVEDGGVIGRERAALLSDLQAKEEKSSQL